MAVETCRVGPAPQAARRPEPGLVQYSMIYYTILYYTILYYTIVYYTIL